jgi:hypothetical protein
LIVHDLERYYDNDPHTVDKKAREGSQSRDDFLRTKHPFLSRLKQILASIHFGSRAKQHEMVDQEFEEKESEDNEGKGGEEQEQEEGEEEAVEVIDENNVEDKVREYEFGSCPPPS